MARCPDLVLNLRKPLGWSSFDVVRLVKKLVAGGKTGHAGTLDPFAQGVLLVCTGARTRDIAALVDAPKEYRGRMRLGITTDTLDISGTITQAQPCAPLTMEQVREAAGRFIGEIDQVPPSFSAIHVAGQRLYKLARAGVQATPEARRVTIHHLEVLAVTERWIDFTVACSKGTYIRALARDLAQSLGTVGFLSHLTRTRIGAYSLAEALEVAALPQVIQSEWSR